MARKEASYYLHLQETTFTGQLINLSQFYMMSRLRYVVPHEDEVVIEELGDVRGSDFLTCCSPQIKSNQT